MDIRWTYRRDTNTHTGVFFGLSAFVIQQVVPGCYRLRNHLPAPEGGGVWEGETYHTELEGAKMKANGYAARAYKKIAATLEAEEITDLPGQIAEIKFVAAYCPACRSQGRGCDYGSHDAITVVARCIDTHLRDRWVIERTDTSHLLVHHGREEIWEPAPAFWGAPEDDRFKWTFGEAMEIIAAWRQDSYH